MRSLVRLLLAGGVAAGCSTLGVLAACGDGSSSSAPLDEAGILNSTERPPGTTCEKDGGLEAGHTFSSGVCAQSSAIPGCRMCLDGVVDGSPGDSVCVNACHVGANECPSGQTCVPQSGGSRSSSNCSTTAGGADSLGYCR